MKVLASFAACSITAAAVLAVEPTPSSAGRTASVMNDWTDSFNSSSAEGTAPVEDWATGYDAAPATEFAVGIGYAHVSVGGSDSALDSEDALRFDPALSFAPVATLPQLRLGAAVGVTLVFDNSERSIISSGGVVITGRSDIPFWLIEPEVRVSWRQPFGEEDRFFIEPGVGVGAVFGRVSIDGEDSSSGESFDESDTSLSGRAFLNVGARVEGGFGGIQVSYLRGGSLHFAENAAGEVEEFYVGIFGALRL
jgi:hypothetical protein